MTLLQDIIAHESFMRESAMSDVYQNFLDALQNDYGIDDSMADKIAEWLMTGKADTALSKFLDARFVKKSAASNPAATAEILKQTADSMKKKYGRFLKYAGHHAR